MARRVTGREEAELLDVAGRLKTAEDEVERVRAERDELIADLMDDQARVSDIAEILGLTQKAVRDSRDRVR